MYNQTTNESSSSTTVTYHVNCTCPGCNGKGWQENIDGIRVTCPMCEGTGKWEKRNRKECLHPYPWYPPYNPSSQPWYHITY